MKTLPLLIIALVACLLCVGPAAADGSEGSVYMKNMVDLEDPSQLIHEIDITDESCTVVAPEGYAIVGMELYVESNNGCNFSLYTDDYAVDGWFLYEEAGFLGLTDSHYSVGVESNSKIVSLPAPLYHTPEVFGVCPGFNCTMIDATSDYVVTSQGVYAYTPFVETMMRYTNYNVCPNLQLDLDKIAYAEIYPLLPIKSVQITNYEPLGSDYPMTVYYAEESAVLSDIEENRPGNVFDHLEETGGLDAGSILQSLYGLLLSVLFVVEILKYIFVEHWFETIMLYEVILLAYSASKSRDIIQFSKKFIKANQALFDYLIKLVDYLVDIVTRIINALKPV